MIQKEGKSYQAFIRQCLQKSILKHSKKRSKNDYGKFFEDFGPKSLSSRVGTLLENQMRGPEISKEMKFEALMHVFQSPFFNDFLQCKLRGKNLPEKEEDQTIFMRNYISNQGLLEDRTQDTDYMFGVTSNKENLVIDLIFPMGNQAEATIPLEIKKGINIHIFQMTVTTNLSSLIQKLFQLELQLFYMKYIMRQKHQLMQASHSSNAQQFEENKEKLYLKGWLISSQIGQNVSLQSGFQILKKNQCSKQLKLKWLNALKLEFQSYAEIGQNYEKQLNEEISKLSQKEVELIVGNYKQKKKNNKKELSDEQIVKQQLFAKKIQFSRYQKNKTELHQASCYYQLKFIRKMIQRVIKKIQEVNDVQMQDQFSCIISQCELQLQEIQNLGIVNLNQSINQLKTISSLLRQDFDKYTKQNDKRLDRIQSSLNKLMMNLESGSSNSIKKEVLLRLKAKCQFISKIDTLKVEIWLKLAENFETCNSSEEFSKLLIEFKKHAKEIEQMNLKFVVKVLMDQVYNEIKALNSKNKDLIYDTFIENWKKEEA